MEFIIILGLLWFVCCVLDTIWNAIDSAVRNVGERMVAKWPWLGRSLW